MCAVYSICAVYVCCVQYVCCVCVQCAVCCVCVLCCIAWMRPPCMCRRSCASVCVPPLLAVLPLHGTGRDTGTHIPHSTRTHVCTITQHPHARTRAPTHTHTYERAYTHAHACMHSHTHTAARTYVYTHTYAHVLLAGGLGVGRLLQTHTCPACHHLPQVPRRQQNACLTHV